MSGLYNLASLTIVVLLLHFTAGSSIPSSESDVVFTSDMTDDASVTDLQLDSSFLCHMCKLYLGMIEHFLNDHHGGESALHILKMVCNFVPIFKNTCIHLIEEYGMLIIHLAQHFLKPEMCHTFLHCPEIATAEPDEQTCMMCKLGVGVLVDTLDDPELNNRIDLYTQDFCKNVGPHDYQCVAMAKKASEHLQHWAAQLKQTTDLKSFCQSTAICGASDDGHE